MAVADLEMLCEELWVALDAGDYTREDLEEARRLLRSAQQRLRYRMRRLGVEVEDD